MILDIDIAGEGEIRVSYGALPSALDKLHSEFEDSLLPFKVDIIDYYGSKLK